LDVPITINGVIFPTSEHYYQWQKFNDPIIKQRIINATTPELGFELVKTGTSPLVQHDIYDNYWADGGNGEGTNMLGKLLVQVRQELMELPAPLPLTSLEDETDLTSLPLAVSEP